MSTSETQADETPPASTEPEATAPIDEAEQFLQRRLARIEEALGLSPLT